MSSILALDKWAAFFRIIAKHGGPFKAFYKLWRMDTLKEGVFKGTDSLGNRYYENPYYMIGRNRWVEFNDQVKWNYDASQIAPEWFGWIHHKTDCLPSEDCAKFCLMCCSCSHRWLLQPQENMTGTECAYYPYSTVRQPIQVWDGCSISQRKSC